MGEGSGQDLITWYSNAGDQSCEQSWSCEDEHKVFAAGADECQWAGIQADQWQTDEGFYDESCYGQMQELSYTCSGTLCDGRKSSQRVVPKRVKFRNMFDKSEGITTVMIRNMPFECTRTMLMHELDRHGSNGFYDFVYVPMDRTSCLNVGYAFVNFTSKESCQRFR